jgi:hypothetical protein
MPRPTITQIPTPYDLRRPPLLRRRRRNPWPVVAGVLAVVALAEGVLIWGMWL